MSTENDTRRDLETRLWHVYEDRLGRQFTAADALRAAYEASLGEQDALARRSEQ